MARYFLFTGVIQLGFIQVAELGRGVNFVCIFSLPSRFYWCTLAALYKSLKKERERTNEK
jgi:hypothetical protein